MENKDMVIVGLVVLLVLVVAFSGSLATTGNVGKRSCSDTDSGSSFVKGTITGTNTAGNSYESTDYCSGENPNYLKEFSCDMGESYEGWTSDMLYCDNGCVDGRCV
ncbi:hypothetical protein J4404_01490 [Candidatus Woesearchaeota archaeon]|nr:hypothetical protein [Candidatus Woesearchaeota archaeon]